MDQPRPRVQSDIVAIDAGFAKDHSPTGTVASCQFRLPSARVRAFGILTCVQDPQHEGELTEPLYMQLKESCVRALQEALARQPESEATDSERAARAAADMSAALAARCAEAGLAIHSLAIEGMTWEQETESGATVG